MLSDDKEEDAEKVIKRYECRYLRKSVSTGTREPEIYLTLLSNNFCNNTTSGISH